MSTDEDRGSEESELEREFHQVLEFEVYLPYRLQYGWEGRETAQQIKLDPDHRQIWCVKFSPSGKSIACVGERILKVWDATGRLESDLASSDEIGFSQIAWSKDGNLLVSGAEHRLKVWNFNTGRCVQELEHEIVFSAKFSPDDSVILSGSDDCTAKIWNAETGMCLNTLDLKHPVEAVDFNHDGTLFTVGCNVCLMYDLRTLDVVRNFTRENAKIVSAKFFPVSRYMLCSMGDGSLSLYDVRNREVAGIYKGNTDFHQPTPNSFSFTTFGKFIVLGSVDNCIYIWKANTQKMVQVIGIGGHSDSVDSVDYDPGNNIIVSGSSDNSIKTWKIYS